MARKFWLYFSFCAIFLLIGQTANAKDGLFGVGARFAWENYKTPVLIHPAATDTGVDVSALNKTHFGGDLQIKPIDRLAITLALDLGYSKYTVQPYIDGSEKAVAASYLSFGFLLGVKFYVIEPAPQKATLYLKLDGGKYIAKAKNNASSQTGNEYLAYQLAMLGDLSAPLVFQFAVGAEFFAAKSFSVGADILGLRMAYSKGDNGPIPADLAATPAAMWSGDQKLITFSIYSALTLNFGFYKGESSKSRDDDEDIGAGDGWGSSGGGAAAEDGWGSGGAGSTGGAAAGAAGAWGAAPVGGAAPAAGDAGWGGAPAEGDAGWGAAPADGDAASGWEATPPPPDDESPIKTNKPKAKPKASGGGGGGGGGGGSGSASPPPPPPGY